MAELHGGDAGDPVDVGAALHIREPHPGTFHDDQRVLHEGLHLVEVDHQVGQAGMLTTVWLGHGTRFVAGVTPAAYAPPARFVACAE